jgi:transcription-repair coupling factor (superfamily II helicase)
MQKYVSGLSGAGKAYFILEEFKRLKQPLLAIVNEDDFSSFSNNLSTLSSLFEKPYIYSFPSHDVFTRINTLNSFIHTSLGIIVSTPEGVKQKTFLPHRFNNKMYIIVSGGGYPLELLTETLVDLGYSRQEFVEEKGHFARRGEILDLWAPDSDFPYRFVFNDNTIESIRTFDISTQRSKDFVKRIMLLPVYEPEDVPLTEYMPKNSVVYFDSSPDDELKGLFGQYDTVINDPLSAGGGAEKEDAGFSALGGYEARFNIFVEELEKFTGRGFKTSVFCSNEGEKERIIEILAEHRIRENMPEMVTGQLEGGFYSSARKIAFFSGLDILYKRRPVSFPKFKSGRRLETLWEISTGDYVVHERYGIGRYLGLKKITHDEHEAEYLQLEYKGGDKLYVPVEDFQVVQKYIGTEGFRPKLHSLDTVAWERIKKKAKENAEQLAKELLALYADREKIQRPDYQAESPWEAELADSFRFSETEDQLKAISDVNSDLASARPMERLICGDVGYGKTEVAIRAAFKVAVASKQVAILVPTTVLAEQHFNTFTDRLSPFPVRIAMLSRFQSKKEQGEVIERLGTGDVDIVIGTHRLLQKDIAFKDLGLLIIDEEHRFGVKQKEKIKSLKKNVDVLMLSATPIPRTLSLALSNIRDLSVIESPPYGRLPIETYLGAYDETIVKRVIEAELSRNGQVFYVFNRVETIESRAEYLKKLVPGIRVGIIHGQLPALDIEKAMWKFLHRELDILVATTIIESGLDIPSVNTMIVEEAEDFGLAQLYQLRGRIGRTDRKAHCYLFSSSKKLSDEAKKRLEALKDLNELGSGFRLALRDLEIRGGGNILGAEQHGFVKEIGFELYSRLIAEAGRQAKGIGTAEEAELPVVAIDLNVQAFIPESYISSDDLRIMFYRRLIAAKNTSQIDSVKDELLDRFGKMPAALVNLLMISGLRLTADRLRIKSIVENDGKLDIFFGNDVSVSGEAIAGLAARYQDKIQFVKGELYCVRFDLKKLGEKGVDFLTKILDEFKNIFADTAAAAN